VAAVRCAAAPMPEVYARLCSTASFRTAIIETPHYQKQERKTKKLKREAKEFDARLEADRRNWFTNPSPPLLVTLHVDSGKLPGHPVADGSRCKPFAIHMTAFPDRIVPPGLQVQVVVRSIDQTQGQQCDEDFPDGACCEWAPALFAQLAEFGAKSDSCERQ
jgi:hypothetical protein